MNACDAWNANRARNPLTRRKIKETGALFKRIREICTIGRNNTSCKALAINNTRHPITKRKLIVTAKNGLYVQLREMCASRAAARSNGPPLRPDHARLIAAVKKSIAPLLHKGDDLKSRIQFAKIARQYLKPASICLQKSASGKKVALKNLKGEDLLVFDKRIGSKSLYGIAHMHAGTRGFHRLIKFASKMMAAESHEDATEVRALEDMSAAVERQFTPNLPITYTATVCPTACKGRPCPALTKKGPYHIILNELADMDLQTWYKGAHSDAEHSSVVAQILLALYAFHLLGWKHNDAHLGNFLVHKVAPGGYWRYRVWDLDVYVRNLGQLLVLWDPGRASGYPERWMRFPSTAAGAWQTDFMRPLGLIQSMKRSYADVKLYGRMRPPSDDVREMVEAVMNAGMSMNADEEERMQHVMLIMAQKTDVVRIGDWGRKEKLLNVRPFLVKR